MEDKISFLRCRHASLFRAVDNLEHNFRMIHNFEKVPVLELEKIQDRIEGAISEVKAIRTAIEDKIKELEAAS